MHKTKGKVVNNEDNPIAGAIIKDTLGNLVETLQHVSEGYYRGITYPQLNPYPVLIRATEVDR